MNLKQYQKEAQRTCALLKSKELNLSHMVMGMASELPEILEAEDEANVAEEITDYMWYLSNYMAQRNISLEDYEEVVEEHSKKWKATLLYCILSLMVATGQLTDIVKKHVAYGKEIDAAKEHEVLKSITKYISMLYACNNIPYKEALQKNIDKLKVRFKGKGFTKQEAINRNTTEESKVL